MSNDQTAIARPKLDNRATVVTGSERVELAAFIDRWSEILNDGPLTADNVHAFDAHGEQR